MIDSAQFLFPMVFVGCLKVSSPPGGHGAFVAGRRTATAGGCPASVSYGFPRFSAWPNCLHFYVYLDVVVHNCKVLIVLAGRGAWSSVSNFVARLHA